MPNQVLRYKTKVKKGERLLKGDIVFSDSGYFGDYWNMYLKGTLTLPGQTTDGTAAEDYLIIRLAPDSPFGPTIP